MCESPGGLVKTDPNSIALGWGLRPCISHQLLGKLLVQGPRSAQPGDQTRASKVPPPSSDPLVSPRGGPTPVCSAISHQCPRCLGELPHESFNQNSVRRKKALGWHWPHSSSSRAQEEQSPLSAMPGERGALGFPCAKGR